EMQHDGVLEALQLRWIRTDAVEKPLARSSIPSHAVIAHRGASYDAPESTDASYRLARDLGADYLELDLQPTTYGKLVVFHDEDARGTTNTVKLFPGAVERRARDFRGEDVSRLDAARWFTRAYPERARPRCAGLKILTLDEVIDIAESGQTRPGLYIETKQPR